MVFISSHTSNIRHSCEMKAFSTVEKGKQFLNILPDLEKASGVRTHNVKKLSPQAELQSK